MFCYLSMWAGWAGLNLHVTAGLEKRIESLFLRNWEKSSRRMPRLFASLAFTGVPGIKEEVQGQLQTKASQLCSCRVTQSLLAGEQPGMDPIRSAPTGMTLIPSQNSVHAPLDNKWTACWRQEFTVVLAFAAVLTNLTASRSHLYIFPTKSQ